MHHGLYAAASAIDAHARREEAVAHNLANVQTVGFKRQVAACQTFDAALGLVTVHGGADRTQGDLTPSDGSLDLALSGPGFLAVETPAGVRYTRAGDLRVDAEGVLTTVAGHPVLGTSGTIRIVGPQDQVRIGEDGRVTAGGEEVGALRLVELDPSTPLEADGAGLLRAVGAGAERPATSTRVRQGFLERSNADPTSELIGLITLHRSFEAAGRAVETTLRALERTANELR